MPYVPGFTSDIFISFSHSDNWDGWVEKFQDHLSHRLVQIGAPVTIWRDTKLRGTDVFSDEIFTQLQQTVLLVSIVSPSGIKSRWCEDERRAFERFAALNGGFRVENQLRAIKVVKTPLPADQHRDFFGVLGFEFYERDGQSDRSARSRTDAHADGSTFVSRKATISGFATNPTRTFFANARKADRNHGFTFLLALGSYKIVRAILIL